MMLELDGVRAQAGTFELGPVDLRVGWETLSVLGPSGCGKTTLLSVVAGLRDVDGGRVRLAGTDLTSLPPQDRNTAYVFQDGALFPHMSVHENVAYAADSPALVEELTEMLEIATLLDRDVSTLSGGERQRVALARALAAEPEALLLDEPLANLDAPNKRRLRLELREVLSDLDIPVIYVTHDQQQATTMGDRVAVLRDGNLRQVGPPEEIFQRPSSQFVAEFTGTTNLFEAEVLDREDDALYLDWGETVIEAPPYDVDGPRVSFCIRPEYVMIVREDRPIRDRANVISGEVSSRTYQGENYIVVFEPDSTTESLEIRLPTPVYERLELGERDSIRVSLKKRALHVIGDERESARS